MTRLILHIDLVEDWIDLFTVEGLNGLFDIPLHHLAVEEERGIDVAVAVKGVVQRAKAQFRLGDDGLANTKDDGFNSVQEAISKTGMDPALADKISVSDRRFVRVVSIGENHRVRSGVWAVFEVGGNRVTPIYWREEPMQ